MREKRDREYNLVIYAGNNLYQCFARVIDRYKSDNIYTLVVELTSNLRKYQRREYYRFSCALEMNSRKLEEEEVRAIEEKDPYSNLIPGLPLKRSVIEDISGGGLRFLSTHPYEPGSLIYIGYNLLVGGKKKEYELVGKVLSSQKRNLGFAQFIQKLQPVHLGHIHIQNYHVIAVVFQQFQCFRAVPRTVGNHEPFVTVYYITQDSSHECRVVNHQYFFHHDPSRSFFLCFLSSSKIYFMISSRQAGCAHHHPQDR